MKVKVEVWKSIVIAFEEGGSAPVQGEYGCIACYVMDHNDPAQRRVLGEQCRNAFEGGQAVITYPVEE